MSREKDKPIVVDANLRVKQSKNLREVKYRAKAGVSEAEAIERHTVGEFNTRRDNEEEEQKEG